MKIDHAYMSVTAYIMSIAPEAVHLDRLGIESGLNLHKTDYLKEADIGNTGRDQAFPQDLLPRFRR